MTHKRLLCPERRRTVPSQFSWLDHRPVALTELFKRMAGDGTDPRQSKGAPHDQL
jgi:hypothetical protein